MAPSAFPGGTHPPRLPGQWQVLFDGGHQQRYLPDRQAVLRYVLAVGPRAASPRFEVLTETAGSGSPTARTAAGSSPSWR